MTRSESLDNLISLPEALAKIDGAVTRLGPSRVTAAQAVGCVLEEDVTATVNVPGFPRSAMDGVALRVADLEGPGPWSLPIQSVIEAGDTLQKSLNHKHAVKIMTGAPLAEGADVVIPIEDVTIAAGRVTVAEKPKAGAFIRPLGNDITSGQVLYRRGDTLRPGDIGILASIGLTEINVIPRPRIALVSTGSEVVEPGVDLKHGQIYDSNIPTLHSLLTYDRYPVATQTRVTTNELEPLRDKLRECLKNHDLVITTGAVSMGDFDFIPDVVETLGGKTLFYKLAVKPGKPTLMADFGNSWLLSLPGNPVSALIGYHLYVRRILSLMMGLRYEPRSSQAKLGDDVTVTGKRFNIIGARLETTPGGLVAYPAQRQESGRLSSTLGINGLLM
ncbi:MAG: molybdopterin molybdotransferase MoeA, partial [Candidatus Zixiibacteriota bacterium]